MWRPCARGAEVCLGQGYLCEAKDYLEHILAEWSDACGRAKKNGGLRMSEQRNSSALLTAPTRRQVIAAVAVAFASLSLRSSEAWAAAEEEISHTAEAIHQEPVFKASRRRVYEALTDAKQFEKIVQLSAAMKSGMAPGGNPAEIGRGAGGAISLFGGYFTGWQREAGPNE